MWYSAINELVIIKTSHFYWFLFSLSYPTASHHHKIWQKKESLDAHLLVEAITSALRLMGGHVSPGDNHSVRGADLVILRESPVYVLGRLSQNTGTKVSAEEDFAHSVTRVQVSLKGCNHAKLWGHLAKIGGLAGWLCCGNKSIGVDLKSKTEVEVMGRARNEITVPLCDSLL